MTAPARLDFRRPVGALNHVDVSGAWDLFPTYREGARRTRREMALARLTALGPVDGVLDARLDTHAVTRAQVLLEATGDAALVAGVLTAWVRERGAA